MRYKNIVVKVGTSTVTHDTGLLNIKRIELLSRTICDLKNSGSKVTLVSSGAIGVGVSRLGFAEKPKQTREVQAVAAVGQVELMNIYSKLFGEYGVNVAQILLTKDVIDDGERRFNAQSTMNTLLDLGVVPIVNENDSISTYEIFGDNDTLSAYVAQLVSADLLVLLSDIDGLYDSDPNINKDAKLIHEVTKITDKIKLSAGAAGTRRGTGGMQTKLAAAEIAMSRGSDMVIANGKDPTVLYDITEGKSAGTMFRR